MNNELPFGIDVSRYDGLLDWNKVRTHVPRIEFIAFRATISWGYIDPFFAANWRACRQHGIPRMAYHVVYPAEIPERQYDYWNTFFDITDTTMPPKQRIKFVE